MHPGKHAQRSCGGSLEQTRTCGGCVGVGDLLLYPTGVAGTLYLIQYAEGVHAGQRGGRGVGSRAAVLTGRDAYQRETTTILQPDPRHHNNKVSKQLSITRVKTKANYNCCSCRNSLSRSEYLPVPHSPRKHRLERHRPCVAWAHSLFSPFRGRVLRAVSFSGATPALL